MDFLKCRHWRPRAVEVQNVAQPKTTGQVGEVDRRSPNHVALAHPIDTLVWQSRIARLAHAPIVTLAKRTDLLREIDSLETQDTGTIFEKLPLDIHVYALGMDSPDELGKDRIANRSRFHCMAPLLGR